VVYEMGHYVNDTLGMFSSRKGKRELYETEAEKISSYAKENDREYFAEVFRIYVTESQHLKLISPSSYQMAQSAVLCFENGGGKIYNFLLHRGWRSDIISIKEHMFAKKRRRFYE